MTMPATMSWRSQDDSYERRVRTPGSQRIQPLSFACCALGAASMCGISRTCRARFMPNACSALGRRSPWETRPATCKDVLRARIVGAVLRATTGDSDGDEDEDEEQGVHERAPQAA